MNLRLTGEDFDQCLNESPSEKEGKFVVGLIIGGLVLAPQ